MRQIAGILILITFLSCKSYKTRIDSSIRLKYLDEYILSGTIELDKTLIGGLSGIDYYNGTYYLVCDDPGNPRFYEAEIAIANSKITKVNIQNVVELKDTTHYLDLEAIRFNSITNQIVLTSEGHVKKQKDPQFFSVNINGELKNWFELPKAFKATSLEKPRHNGTLEGLSTSVDNKGYWIAMELPLEIDGPEPQLVRTNSPVRITYIDTTSNQAKRQFAYSLDSISKKPKGNFAVNGLTDILEYAKDKFFIIERSYSSGLGSQGNTVKIFKVDASKATNTLKLSSLKNANFIAATKELVFDFERVRDQLTDNSIDNIEGITFGPRLHNQHRTLILVSDNNFNKLGTQLNQFILLEIID